MEFVGKEMFRESNTIGSKENDSKISKHVVLSKALLEKSREQIQNIEWFRVTIGRLFDRSGFSKKREYS